MTDPICPGCAGKGPHREYHELSWAGHDGERFKVMVHESTGLTLDKKLALEIIHEWAQLPHGRRGIVPLPPHLSVHAKQMINGHGEVRGVPVSFVSVITHSGARELSIKKKPD